MAKYRCPMCNHINKLDLHGDNKYRCENCKKMVRALEVSDEAIAIAKAVNEDIKKIEKAIFEEADLNKDGKVDEKDVEIVEKASKKSKKKRGRKKNEEK